MEHLPLNATNALSKCRRGEHISQNAVTFDVNIAVGRLLRGICDHLRSSCFSGVRNMRKSGVCTANARRNIPNNGKTRTLLQTNYAPMQALKDYLNDGEIDSWDHLLSIPLHFTISTWKLCSSPLPSCSCSRNKHQAASLPLVTLSTSELRAFPA